MEAEKDTGGVSEHQLELARLAKEAFDNHRYFVEQPAFLSIIMAVPV